MARKRSCSLTQVSSVGPRDYLILLNNSLGYPRPWSHKLLRTFLVNIYMRKIFLLVATDLSESKGKKTFIKV